MGAALAQKFDAYCLTGTGSAQILGIVNFPAATGINTIGSVGSPTYDDIIDAIAAIETDNHTPNAWVISPAVKQTLAKLQVNSEANHYVTPPSEVSELLRLVTTAIADANAVVGDFEQAMLGIRQNIILETTTQGDNTFSKHQVGLKVTMRGDINLRWANAFCVLSGIS